MKCKKILSIFIAVAFICSGSPSAYARASKPASPAPLKPLKKEKAETFPEFPKLKKKEAAGRWLNTKPLDAKFFEQKLTLVYFWDYTSINCIREFSILEAWQENYGRYGLQVLWIHAPEFTIGHDAQVIQSAAARFKIKGPIYLDNDFKLWEELKVKSWPTKILVDERGKILLNRSGEGNYSDIEDEIRSRLKDLDPNMVLPDKNFTENVETYNMERCGTMTAETYLGYKKATWWGAKLSNQQHFPENETLQLKDYGERTDRGFFVEGLWTNREEFLEHARNTGTLYDYAGVVYQGQEVYAVLHTTHESGRDARVYVTRDDKPVPEKHRGIDVKVDEKGETFVETTEPRLYYLIEGEDADLHELRLWTASSHVAISSFSFSNRCLSDFEHR